ncbi:MAG: VanZ family protein [Clostridium sp.]
MSKKSKIIRWTMLIMWMAFIFYMSHQNGETSSSQSGLILNIIKSFGFEMAEKYSEFVTLIIRKGAHFTEYCILYILIYRVVKMYKAEKAAIYISLLLTFGYACSDEFHQMFVPGRGPAFKDVLIDTSGGVFGIILTKIYYKVKGEHA